MSLYFRSPVGKEGRGVKELVEAKGLTLSGSAISESATRLIGIRMRSPLRLSSSFSRRSSNLKLSRR
jgi:hypothetical protein